MLNATARRSAVLQGDYGRVTLNLTGRALVEHAHSEFNFIFKIGGGDTGFQVAGERQTLTDDRAVLVNPWEPHAKLASEGAPTLVLTFLLNPDWFLAAVNARASTSTKFFPQPFVDVTPPIREDVVRLAMILTSPHAADFEPEPFVRSLTGQLFQHYSDADLALQNLFTGPAMDARVMRATRFMRERAADNPGLDDIAREVGLSRSRFFEQFKHCMGVSPQQYLDWQRMALATRLLSRPELSVADVSHGLGFSAPSHFARFFAQHVGFPPSDFKRGVMGAGPGQA